MSLAAADRIAEIQSLVAALQTGRVPEAARAAAPTTSFAGQLSQATTATATASTATAAAAPASTASAGSGAYAAELEAAAARHGVDPALLRGLVQQESGFDPDARSGAGAVGLTQLMPATAAALGVTDPTDPAQSLDGGAAYLRQQLDRFGGDESKALAAYNAGPGAVQRFGGVPPYAETQNYVRSVLANAGRTA